MIVSKPKLAKLVHTLSLEGKQILNINKEGNI